MLKCHDTVDALAGYIASLDDSLRRCDYFLHKLQPPHKGRVRIKLVLRKGTYVPSPIEEFYVKAIGEWTYKQLPNTHLPKRAKRTKAFYDTAKQVVEVLCVAQELLAKAGQTGTTAAVAVRQCALERCRRAGAVARDRRRAARHQTRGCRRG